MFRWFKLRKMRKLENQILENNVWYTNRSSDYVSLYLGDE